MKDRGLPTIRFRTMAGETLATVDTGCLQTCIREDVVEGLGGEHLKLHPQYIPTGVDGIGGSAQVVGTVRLQWVVGSGIIPIDAFVIRSFPVELLLGGDLIEDHQLVVDGRNKCIEVTTGSGNRVSIEFDEGKRESLPVYYFSAKSLESSKKLQPRAHHTLRVAVDAPDGTSVLIEPYIQRFTNEVLWAPTTSRVKNGMALVSVINTADQVRKIPTTLEIGTWSPAVESGYELRSLSELDNVQGTTVLGRFRQILKGKGKGWLEEPLPDEDEIQFGNQLNDMEKEMLIQVLRQFPDVFAPSDGSPGLVEGVQCDIDTGTANPILQKRWRHTPEQLEQIRENIEELLSKGIIEPGEGQWGFPVVMVKKKDGSWRFCVDFRSLNAITQKDVYPLPRIDETIEHTAGARIFSVVDALSGYWNVKMGDSSKDKAAVSTKFGLFRFLRMPFGLTNAPAIFQRLMDTVLRGLVWVCCLVYLDDIIIYSRSFGGHLVYLIEVLYRLQSAGIKLKSKKCVFAADEVNYLGFKLTPEGLQRQERIVQGVTKFPRPTNQKTLKGFLGLAGYYRRFIREFAKLAFPLNNLLKKNTTWVWGAECEAAFRELKRRLTTAPVLILPDFTKLFLLVTDAACTKGIGGALMQQDVGCWKPVAFISRSLTPAEKNYTVTELECLGVVWCIKQFRHFLYGRRFEV